MGLLLLTATSYPKMLNRLWLMQPLAKAMSQTLRLRSWLGSSLRSSAPSLSTLRTNEDVQSTFVYWVAGWGDRCFCVLSPAPLINSKESAVSCVKSVARTVQRGPSALGSRRWEPLLSFYPTEYSKTWVHWRKLDIV